MFVDTQELQAQFIQSIQDAQWKEQASCESCRKCFSLREKIQKLHRYLNLSAVNTLIQIYSS